MQIIGGSVQFCRFRRHCDTSAISGARFFAAGDAVLLELSQVRNTFDISLRQAVKTDYGLLWPQPRFLNRPNSPPEAFSPEVIAPTS